MEKINLEEIFEKHRQGFINNQFKHPDYIIDAMRESCKKVLELAAENAEVDILNKRANRPQVTVVRVDKQSILDVINLIE